VATQPEDIFLVCIMLVEREIVLKNQQQQNTNANAKGKTKYVEQGKELVFQENPDEEFDMGKKHSGF